MRVRILALLPVFALLIAGSAPAQDKTPPEQRILKAVEKTLDRELARIREEVLELVRSELRKAGGKPSQELGGFEAALHRITVEAMKKDAMTLAGDGYRGRNAGYPGNDRAAKYIADEFARIGLKPVGDRDAHNHAGYLQRFTFRSFYTGGSPLKTQNVVGLWEGSDPLLKNEIVVVGGHFDHVGTASEGRHLGRLGRPTDNDEIWNGADDNASGTTCVMAVARAFAEGKIRTKRSILFILFSAEEAGLYGSKYYCNNPIAPISKHVFMLNLDMVGRNPERPVQIKGVGSAQGDALEQAVKDATAKAGLNAKIERSATIFGGDSDHSSFQAKGIPFAFFFSGFHGDYHRVTDHPDKLAYANMVKVARTGATLLRSIADRQEPLRFAGAGRRPFRFDQPDRDVPRPRRALGVTIETVDEEECKKLGLAENQGAVRIETVNPESAAKKAGLQAEDILVSLGGKSLGRANPRRDLRNAVQAVKPGQGVEIVLFRKGKRMTVTAKWDK